jgi:GDP-4-dehydro-6-deoxy-D-mannose reductase
MHILITGVAGFVGSHLCRHLLDHGYQVTGTFIGDMPELSGVDLIEVDLLDASRLEEVVAGVAPDRIVHLAGLSHVGESWQQPELYFRVNVIGSENLLRAARGARVIVASSAEVYGAVPEGEQPLTEDRDLAPMSPYGMSKAAMERIAAYHEAIIVRSFNICGPGQASMFALPAFAHQLRAIAGGDQAPVIQVGNLSARRDFIHVDDAATGYRALLERGQPGRVYNLGSGQAHSIQAALDELIRISGVSPDVAVDPERFRKVDVPLLVASTEPLQALGWEARKTLPDALRDLWDETAGAGIESS